MPTPEALEIIARYDRLISSLEREAIARLNASLTASYRQINQQLRRAIAAGQEAGPLRYRAVIEQRLGQLLQGMGANGDIEGALRELAVTSQQAGLDLSAELLEELSPDDALLQFADVDIEAAAAQAAGGARRLGKHGEVFAERASAIVEQGLIQGQSIRRITNGLQQQLGVVRSRAETIARTESMSALNAAASQRYADAGVEGEQWIAIADSVICPFCSARNGSVYPTGKAVIPGHPRCRCMKVPWSEKWDTRDNFVRQYHKEGVKKAIAAGVTPDNGPSPFEKAGGVRPKIIWRPGSSSASKSKLRRAPQKAPRLIPEDFLHSNIPGFSTTFNIEAAAAERSRMLEEPLEKARLAAVRTRNRDIRYLRQKEREAINLSGSAAQRKELGAFDRLRPKELSTLIQYKTDNPDAFSALMNEYRSLLRREQSFSRQKLAQRGRRLLQELDITEPTPREMQRLSPRLQRISREEAKALAKKVRLSRKAQTDGVQDFLVDALMLLGDRPLETLDSMKYVEARAYADQSNRTINTGALPSKSIIWHELGHHLEFSNPLLAKAAQEWRDQKGKGSIEKLSAITGNHRYGADEMAVVGDFIDPYMGKIYPDGATEVISMGLESFTTPERMADLLEQDRSLFEFMLGVLTID